MTTSSAAGVEVRGPRLARFDEVLSADALDFLARLHREFNTTREALLARRHERQARFDAGELPDFLSETRGVREDDWRVAPVTTRDLQKRWVELTGPTERKMLINALNSGADTYMADFEDANTPTWQNMVEGQMQSDRRHRSHDLVRQPRRANLSAQRARPRRCWFGRAAGICPRSTSSSTAARSPAPSWTSGCTSSTTRGVCSNAGVGRTSICPSSKATAKHACGTTSSRSPRTHSAFRAARSRPPCCSKS